MFTKAYGELAPLILFLGKMPRYPLKGCANTGRHVAVVYIGTKYLRALCVELYVTHLAP